MVTVEFTTGSLEIEFCIAPSKTSRLGETNNLPVVNK